MGKSDAEPLYEIRKAKTCSTVLNPQKMNSILTKTGIGRAKRWAANTTPKIKNQELKHEGKLNLGSNPASIKHY
jgi:hypothetical protein